MAPLGIKLNPVIQGLSLIHILTQETEKEEKEGAFYLGDAEEHRMSKEDDDMEVLLLSGGQPKADLFFALSAALTQDEKKAAADFLILSLIHI